jgi:acetyl esterase/lipase
MMARMLIQTQPEICPGRASDAILSQFPPTALMVGDIDPMLDDSVSFAKRLIDVRPACFRSRSSIGSE